MESGKIHQSSTMLAKVIEAHLRMDYNPSLREGLRIREFFPEPRFGADLVIN